MLDLCVFKAGVEWEVAFSQQRLLLPLKQNIFLSILQQYATGSRGDGVKPEAPGCMYQSFIMECVVFLSAGKKSPEDGRKSDSHRLAYEKLCVASGVLFSFGLSPSQFFLTEVF